VEPSIWRRGVPFNESDNDVRRAKSIDSTEPIIASELNDVVRPDDAGGKVDSTKPREDPGSTGAPIQPAMLSAAAPAPRRTYACYECGNTGHLLKDCPTLVAAMAAQPPK